MRANAVSNEAGHVSQVGKEDHKRACVASKRIISDMRAPEPTGKSDPSCSEDTVFLRDIMYQLHEMKYAGKT